MIAQIHPSNDDRQSRRHTWPPGPRTSRSHPIGIIPKKRKSVPITIKKTEIVVLIVFSMLIPTIDNYSDLRVSALFLTGTYTPAGNYTSSGKIITPVPQYKYAFFTFLPVLISFLFTLKHWWSKENNKQKKLKTLPYLIFQVWPQSRVGRILYFFWKGSEKWIEEKEYYDIELSTLEPFVESVPQVFVLTCISALSGQIRANTRYSYYGRVSNCIDINCGIVGSPINPDADYFFFSTYLLSVVSASFGMCRFLKSGPMTLVPRTSFGFSFILSMFIVAIGLISKGVILAYLITGVRTSSDFSINFLVWISCNVLPSLIYAFLLAVWTVGAKETCSNLLPRFPGIFLFPVFGPFMFGPKSTGKCCDWAKYGSKQMEVSFFHSYMNIIIWGGGAVLSMIQIHSHRSYDYVLGNFLTIILPIMIFLAILVGWYQILDNACCACCYPFTERSVFVNQEESQEKDEETIEMNQLA